MIIRSIINDLNSMPEAHDLELELLKGMGINFFIQLRSKWRGTKSHIAYIEEIARNVKVAPLDWDPELNEKANNADIEKLKSNGIQSRDEYRTLLIKAAMVGRMYRLKKLYQDEPDPVFIINKRHVTFPLERGKAIFVTKKRPSVSPPSRARLVIVSEEIESISKNGNKWITKADLEDETPQEYRLKERDGIFISRSPAGIILERLL
jgi:hypothetical protein